MCVTEALFLRLMFSVGFTLSSSQVYLEGIDLLLSKAGLVMVNSFMFLTFFKLQWKTIHVVNKIYALMLGVRFEPHSEWGDLPNNQTVSPSSIRSYPKKYYEVA